MKTHKNLYPQIHNFGNLYIAFQAARKAKRDRVAVASFEFNLERNLLKLETELRDGPFIFVETQPTIKRACRWQVRGPALCGRP
jgi:hypothetical protein